MPYLQYEYTAIKGFIVQRVQINQLNAKILLSSTSASAVALEVEAIGEGMVWLGHPLVKINEERPLESYGLKIKFDHQAEDILSFSDLEFEVAG